MTCRQCRMVMYWIVVGLTATSVVFGAGGTSIVATEGHPAHLSAGWPDGVGELVNSPMRTTGWNSWFSEWPNNVNQYAFEVKSTDDINRLIEKLMSIKSDVRQIRLSHLKEPNSLGWVTRLPEGNNIAVIFSIGDQSRIDGWYEAVRKPFGVMEFTAAPIAVPPTLTIFVQNKSVNLEQIRIPKGIHIVSGYVPTVFHRFNTTSEKRQEEEAERKSTDKGQSQSVEVLEPSSEATSIRIKSYLEKHKAATDQ